MPCTERTLDFIVKDDDPEAKVVEDDIRADLEKIGIKVNTIFLDSDAYSEAERDGSYHMLLSRTWVSAFTDLNINNVIPEVHPTFERFCYAWMH